MSRTKRSRFRGCMGDQLASYREGWIPAWKVHRDGPSNLGPGKDFKRKYRRRLRHLRKRIDADELRPVMRRCVEYDWW